MGQIVSDVTSVIDSKKSKKEAQSQRAEILRQMAADAGEKTNLVKKTLATQRAKYGASGMSTTGATEGAVLKRLQSETEQPFEEKKRTNLEKLKNIKSTKSNLLTRMLSRFDELLG